MISVAPQPGQCVALDAGNLTVVGTINASGAAPGSIQLSANGNLELTGTAKLDASGSQLQADSSGEPIVAENAGAVTLTVDAGINAPNGTLLLDPGATINVGGQAGALGDIELNVPRLGGVSGSVGLAISAGGPLNLIGAQTVAVNGFWTYTPSAGTIVQTQANSAGSVGLDQINADNASFMANALVASGSGFALNPMLQAALGGLSSYSSAFHLRPGVEIVSATPNGNLTVAGDLDLSSLRYNTVNATTPSLSAKNYGSGEPGVLVIRAGGNLVVNGSITDGFAKPPATPDDAGWVVYNGAEANGQSILLPITVNLTATTSRVNASSGMTLVAGTIPVWATPFVVVKPATLGANVLLTVASPLTASATIPAGTVLTADILSSTGSVLVARGTMLTSALTVPAGATLSAGTMLPIAVTVQPGGSAGWPSGVALPFAVVLSSTTPLMAGTFLPAGTILALAGTSPLTGNNLPTRATTNSVQGSIYALAPMLTAGDLSWSFQLVGGAEVGAADTTAVQTTTALQAEATATNSTPGSITLSDLHYMSPKDTTLRNNEVFSVIRTGTGSLSLVAGGNFTEDSIYGIYTAGTQSTGVPGADEPTRPGLGGVTVTPLNPGIGILGANTSSGTNDKIGSVTYASALTAQIADGYEAYYPIDGGNLLVSAQGNLTGNTLPATNTTDASNAVGNWLWRQGGNTVTTAWWINFGTYVPIVDAGAVNTTTVTLEGATGIGTFGGGNVTVLAGGNAGLLSSNVANGANRVSNTALNVIVASTAYQIPPGNPAPTGQTPGPIIVLGGGNLSLNIGGALNQVVGTIGQGSDAALGTLTDMRGDISVTAGSIGTVNVSVPNSFSLSNDNDPRPVSAGAGEVGNGYGGPVLVIGDGSASLTARGDVVLTGVGNPTEEDQTELDADLAANNGSPMGANLQQSWFSLWNPNSTVNLLSIGGNVTPISSLGTMLNDNPVDLREIYPPILNVTAASGSIYYVAAFHGQNAGISLETAPSPSGQVAFLAQDGIYGEGTNDVFGASRTNVAIDISGANPSVIPTPENPAYLTYPASSRQSQMTNASSTGDVTPDSIFAFGPDTATGLHDGDPTSALFYAVTGDIVGLMTGETYVFSPFENGGEAATWYIGGKSVRIRAGRDVVGVGTRPGIGEAGTENATITQGLIVNANATDVSEVIAGRDIIYLNLDVAGSGQLYVQAARNVTQNNYGVLESIGPVFGVNSATRDKGADIAVLAGVGTNGPNWTDFASLYLDPANLANSITPLQDQPGKVVRNYDDQLFTWLQQRGYSGTEAGAVAAFDALPLEQQRVFLLQVYYNELIQSDSNYNDPTSRFYKSYLPGNEAIAALFPTTDASGQPITYNGNLTMYSGNELNLNNQQVVGSNGKPVVSDGGIRTDFGGNIDALVPGGQIIVGVTGLTPGANAGLLTQGSGDINLYSYGSVLLGQSRIFTTFGGGILIWSADGDINAGRGAKTTVVSSPPQIAYDDFGDITLAPTVPATGAGIATLAPIAAIPPGDVNLVAPLGTIDPGEAGIRSSGNVTVAALVVVNVGNIQAKGKTIGVPQVPVPNVAAESAASAATGAAQNAMQATRAATRSAPSIITVHVLGYGGDGSDMSDPAAHRTNETSCHDRDRRDSNCR